VKRSGRLDLLFNNAGVIAAGPLQAADDDDMARMLATNVLAPFALSRELVPFLRNSTSPRIVNIGSMFGDIAFPHFVGYSATKFALRGLSDGLRRELKPLGIGVTYAAPRAARTEAIPAIAHVLEALGTKLDEPEAVARRIVDAALAGRRSVYPAGPERLFVLLARLLPALVDRSVAAQLDGKGRTTDKAPVGTARAK
jgi:short-subunit dehydrogenase